MDFEKEFPLRFIINLGRRSDRLHETEAQLAEAGLWAERFPAYDARTKASKQTQSTSAAIRGYETAGRYALALTQRAAIREAKRRKAPNVLIFEDDVILHPNFNQLVSSIKLPKDWGIFYFGCTHVSRPEWSEPRIVKCSYAVDTHAVAISAKYYDVVLSMLDRHGKQDLGVAQASDQFLALLHKSIPSYAIHPNLAWQSVSRSDLIHKAYSNYNPDGGQLNFPEVVEDLLPALVSENAYVGVCPPKLGLLFLTKDNLNQSQMWQEYLSEEPESVKIYSHSKFPDRLTDPVLAGTRIKSHFATNWGDISLVKASRAMLIEALKDESLTHFVLLSESCVPVCPLPQLLKRLEVDPRSQFSWLTIDQASPMHVWRASGSPNIPKKCWRFSPQWWLLNREAAVFSAGMDFTSLFSSVQIPDEGYFQTVLSLQGYPMEGNVVRRDSTWTSWEEGSGSPTTWDAISRSKVAEIVESGAFFARKFSRHSDVGKYGLHRSSRKHVTPRL